MKWNRKKVEEFTGVEYVLKDKDGAELASIVQLDESMTYPGRWWGTAEVKVTNGKPSSVHKRTLAEAKRAMEEAVSA